MASAIFIGDNRGFFLHHVRDVLLFFLERIATLVYELS